MKYLNSKTMKYKGKKRKVKNPLIWANWKLREQLHAAKHELTALEQALEQKESEFFTVALHIRERRADEKKVTCFFTSQTYTSIVEAKTAYDFMVKSNGVCFCEYEVKLIDKFGKGLFYFFTPDFHPKKEREATND